MRVSYVRVKYHHINIIAIRLYESVISKDVVDHPNRNRNNFLNDKQYGFYYHRSSADVLTVITGRNSNRIVNKFIASKSFDNVWQRGLLSSYGFSGSISQLSNPP